MDKNLFRYLTIAVIFIVAVNQIVDFKNNIVTFDTFTYLVVISLGLWVFLKVKSFEKILR